MKKDLRKQMIGSLQQLSEQQYAKQSAIIHQKLVELPLFQEANTIGVTISRFPEVDTLQLIETCWSLGKEVVVPRCHIKDRRMDFYRIENFDTLETVYIDLREPKEDPEQWIHPDRIDLLIVPGVVYGKSGYRIGFGGGYYDRFLVGFKGQTLSLAFDQQLIEKVPFDAHDIPVPLIITDKKIWRCDQWNQNNP